MSDTIYIFAGPSLYRSGLTPSSFPDVHWLPPVRRGDVARLMEGGLEPGAIAIADGTFHAYPSVSHAEIRGALKAGWNVYGVCSMGAIRAAEMRHMGMMPWGRVAAMFCENPWMADDEVALVHGNEDPYVPLSEPLVHTREFMGWAVGAGLLERRLADQMLESIQGRWYGERTMALLERQLFQSMDGSVPEPIREALQEFDRFRLKQKDLSAFVKSAPWKFEGST